MNNDLIADLDFVDQSYTETPFPKGEYDNCTFRNCTFTGVDLSKISFSECAFEGCDLSNAILVSTALKDIEFSGCKLLGLRFEDTNPFLLQLRFHQCQLDYSSFYDAAVAGTNFGASTLREVDFTEANLEGASLNGCDLTGAVFDRTNLQKADVRNAIGLELLPENNQLKGARFSNNSLAGLVLHHGIRIE